MRDLHYVALIHKDADSGYGVSFPDLPGVIAVADTLDAAIAEGAAALAFALEDWPGGQPLPRTLEDWRAVDAFREAMAEGIVAAIRPSPAYYQAAE